MNVLIDISRNLLAALGQPATWWQLLVLVLGTLLALLAGQQLQRRLRPEQDENLSLREVHPAVLALMPLLLWLWLLAASALLGHLRIPTALLHYATLLVGALALIRIGIYVLRRSLSPGVPLQAWEGVLTLTIFALVALHVLGWLDPISAVLDEYAISFGSLRISLLTVGSFALSIALLLLIALSLANTIRDRLRQSDSLTLSMKIALTKLSKFFLLTAAVVIALAAAGIDLTALGIFTGALGVALGVGLQRSFANLVGGFILVFEESVRPGDVISIGGTTGTVQALNARHVAVRNQDGLEVLIPNEEFITSQVTNWSTGDGAVRIHLPVRLHLRADPEKALLILLRVAQSQAGVRKDPHPEAYVTLFGENAIETELVVWIDVDTPVAPVRSALYLALSRELRAQGVPLAGNEPMAAVGPAAARLS